MDAKTAVIDSKTGMGGGVCVYRGQNEMGLSYVSVSLVLPPLMHNERRRHALWIEFEYNLMRASITWPP